MIAIPCSRSIKDLFLSMLPKIEIHGRIVFRHVKCLPLIRLSVLDIEDFYAELKRKGVSQGSRRQAAVVLTNALHHAVRLKLIPTLPTTGVTKPKLTEREMQVLTDDQVKVFLIAALRSRHYALFCLAVATGLRRRELLALHWSDVDFDSSTVTVRRTLVMVGEKFILKEPKSKATRRTITVPPFAMDALRQHRKKMIAKGFADKAVFCNCRGGFIRGYNLLRNSFQPILARTGLRKLRFHDLCHTHATALLSKGHSIKAVSQRLGHSDIAVTLQVYTDVLPTDDAKLATALQTMYA